MKLTDRQQDVLMELQAYCDRYPDTWARTMDVGGSNRSHHSATLAQLVKKGLVKIHPLNIRLGRSKMGKGYRITPAGRRALGGEGLTDTLMWKLFAYWKTGQFSRKEARKVIRAVVDKFLGEEGDNE